MNFGASYDEVELNGFISVIALGTYGERKDRFRKSFDEQMAHLARRMAKTEICSASEVNKLLMSELIEIFKNVKFSPFVTPDQINSRIEREFTTIYALVDPRAPRTLHNIIEKPQAGRLVLCSDDDGQYIPVPLSHRGSATWRVPLVLDEKTILEIGGPVGDRIRSAYKTGNEDVRKHRSAKRRILREKEILALAGQEIKEFIDQSPATRPAYGSSSSRLQLVS